MVNTHSYTVRQGAREISAQYIQEPSGRVWASHISILRTFYTSAYPYLVMLNKRYDSTALTDIPVKGEWRPFQWSGHYIEMIESDKVITPHPRPGPRGGIVVCRFVSFTLEEALSAIRAISRDRLFNLSYVKVIWAVQNLKDNKRIIL